MANKWLVLSINLFLLAALAVCMVWSMCVGKYPITPLESLQIVYANILGLAGPVDPMAESVVMGLRLPRILAAVVIGAVLSMSGATYQGIFKNPLVSPDFLGVSSGACIGAAIAILMALSATGIQIFAFCGGLLAVTITVAIPRLLKSDSNIMLVLSGIIVGGLLGSLLGLLKYIADPETQLATIVYWQMGSLSYVNLPTLGSVMPAIIVSTIVILSMSWWIDVISLGERDAQTLGVNVRWTRNVAILCSTLLTASAVCVAGTIGWLGLVIPHFARMLVGPENTRLLPAAALVGAIFLLLVDTAARTIGSSELPLSILTGIIGAPFFAWLLYKRRMKLH
ncbi:MAG: iron ABC transporter permease [Syntrophomonas sp.]|nr:iron ABC transporter permease [Syntrophomonas sp.]